MQELERYSKSESGVQYVCGRHTEPQLSNLPQSNVAILFDFAFYQDKIGFHDISLLNLPLSALTQYNLFQSFSIIQHIT